MSALWKWLQKFEVPDNNPCFVSWSVTPEWEFRMTLWDEYWSQIRVNQFNASVGESWPILEFNIMHDEIWLKVHRSNNKPVVFIGDKTVLYSGPILWLRESDHPEISSYVETLDRHIWKI